MFCFMGFTVEEDHIFGSFRGVAEAVAEVEAERGAVFIAGGKACPIPCIVVCPDSSSPIEEPHRGSGVEGSFIVSAAEFSLCRHAVYFYVIIKCLCIFITIVIKSSGGEPSVISHSKSLFSSKFFIMQTSLLVFSSGCLKEI